MSEGYQSDGIAGLGTAANAINNKLATEKASKFVGGYCVSPSAVTVFGSCAPIYPANATNWIIIVGIAATAQNGIPTTLNSKTIALYPNVQNSLPTSGGLGSIDWGCASASNITATNRGLTNIGLGSVPAKYAPSECR